MPSIFVIRKYRFKGFHILENKMSYIFLVNKLKCLLISFLICLYMNARMFELMIMISCKQFKPLVRTLHI